MSTLCVFKTHRDNKYSSINLTAEEDKNLSWGAKGLHTYLISRPPEWEVFFSELLTRSNEGKSALRSYLQELCSNGYLDWKQGIDPVTKRYVSVHYDVYEIANKSAIENFKSREYERQNKKLNKEKTIAEPQSDFPQAVNPDTGIPESGSPVSGKQATNNNHSSNNQISNNQEEVIKEKKQNIIAPNGAPAEKKFKEKKQPTEHQLLTDAIAEVCGKNLEIEAHARQCGKASGAIKKAGATPELVREKFGDNGWWYKYDFRGKQGACPSPHVIIDTWGLWEKQNETKTNGVTSGKSNSYAEGQRKAAERYERNQRSLEAFGLA